MCKILEDLKINELACRARGFDEQAFKELAEHLTPRIFNFLRRRGASREVALDIAQETWVKVIENLDNISTGEMT